MMQVILNTGSGTAEFFQGLSNWYAEFWIALILVVAVFHYLYHRKKEKTHE